MLFEQLATHAGQPLRRPGVHDVHRELRQVGNVVLITQLTTYILRDSVGTMMPDATYFSDPALAPVRHLQRAGQWDLALGLLGDKNADLRAEILTERFMWQLVPVDLADVNAASPELAKLLIAQISYWHKLFELEGGPDIDEAAVFAAAPGGWAAFWHGVVQDNVHKNEELARAEYARAHELEPDDRFLESYVVRHQGGHLLDTDRPKALTLFRRSIQLRAALGARPQVAAAQSLLARFLPKDDPETIELRQIVAETAEELNISWLRADATRED